MGGFASLLLFTDGDMTGVYVPPTRLGKYFVTLHSRKGLFANDCVTSMSVMARWRFATLDHGQTISSTGHLRLKGLISKR